MGVVFVRSDMVVVYERIKMYLLKNNFIQFVLFVKTQFVPFRVEPGNTILFDKFPIVHGMADDDAPALTHLCLGKQRSSRVCLLGVHSLKKYLVCLTGFHD
jgi:hypothetical protein